MQICLHLLQDRTKMYECNLMKPKVAYFMSNANRKRSILNLEQMWIFNWKPCLKEVK